MSKVNVKINSKDGTYTIEVNGVEGSKCEEITEALTRHNEVVDQQFTEEYEVPEELPDYIADPCEGGEDE